MHSQLNALAVCFRFSTAALSAFFLLPLIAANAQGTGQIVRIEEDWELVVAVPDVSTDGPQLVCTMSPTQDIDGLYATFEVNHRSSPEFASGGLHLQVWNGDYHLTTKSFPNQMLLATADERVSWTQRIEIQNGQLLFEVVGGSSTTWGQFGGEGNLKASVPTSLTSLNGYSHVNSANNSGVTYASNRVKSLTLKSVRTVFADGTVLSQSVSHVVHSETD
jgi:hypothetical protein